MIKQFIAGFILFISLFSAVAYADNAPVVNNITPADDSQFNLTLGEIHLNVNFTVNATGVNLTNGTLFMWFTNGTPYNYTIEILAETLEMVSGINLTGLNNTFEKDDIYLILSELGTPGIDARLSTSSIPADRVSCDVHTEAIYIVGSDPHDVDLQDFNYTGNSWLDCVEIEFGNPEQIYTCGFQNNSDFVNGTNATGRLFHPQPANPTHLVWVDHWGWHCDDKKQTILLQNNTVNFTLAHLEAGTYLWNWESCNGNNNCSSFPANYTIIIGADIIPPSIDFIPPTPSNNSIVNISQVFINVSLGETAKIILLEWDGVNETMNISAPKTYFVNKTNLELGTYEYRVFASDNQDNLNVSETRIVTFSVDGLVVSCLRDGNCEGWWIKDQFDNQIKFRDAILMILLLFGIITLALLDSPKTTTKNILVTEES